MQRALTLLLLTLAVMADSASDSVRADDVVGFGRTVEDARSDARQHALDRLKSILHDRDPPLSSWRPTLADVDRFAVGPGRAGPSVHVEPLGLQHQWILPVRFPDDAELIRRDQQILRQECAVVAVGVLAILLAVAWMLSTQRRGRE